MRITHYIRRVLISDGGVCRAVLDMCMYQARAGADVTLLTFDATDVPAAWKAGGPGLPRVRQMKHPGRFRVVVSGGFRKEVEPLVRESDALHLHDMWDPAQVPMMRAAMDLRKPYVQTPHGMLADWSLKQKKAKKDIYFALFARSLIDNATFIHLTAQAELDQSQKRHPKTPGVVIPLVFDLTPYRTLPGPEPARKNLKLPSPEKPSLLYLSRLHYKKRPDLLIAAGRPLRDMGLDFNIVIGGPSDAGYESMLRDFAKQERVDDITTILGMVPAEYKTSLYQACDVFVLPTSMENFGFVYFEALASATPLVTTKGTDTWKELEGSGGGRIVGMIPSDVKDGQVGGGDVRELAETLAALIRACPSLKGMGESGRRWVFEHLEPDDVVRQYFTMYERAIAAKK
ncbi:MAG: glycosyltransferase [Phycisphaerales bacterium]